MRRASRRASSIASAPPSAVALAAAYPQSAMLTSWNPFKLVPPVVEPPPPHFASGLLPLRVLSARAHEAATCDRQRPVHAADGSWQLAAWRFGQPRAQRALSAG